MINFITKNFNNREISLAIWLFILLVVFLAKEEIRSSALNVIKVFFGKKIFTIYLSMTAYVILLIYFLYEINFWNSTLLKETIFWYLGVAFVSLVNANKVNQDEKYFQKISKDNLKLIVILEFITSLYSFSLVVELFLVPLLLLIALLSAYTEVYKKEYYQVKKVVDTIFSLIGLLILIFAFYKIITDFKSLANTANLTSFLLPPILTFLFIPFIYLFALLMSYETFFVRLDFLIKNKHVLKYTKWKIFASFHFRLRKLNKFSKEYYQLNEESNNDIKKAIRLFKNKKAG